MDSSGPKPVSRSSLVPRFYFTAGGEKTFDKVNLGRKMTSMPPATDDVCICTFPTKVWESALGLRRRALLDRHSGPQRQKGKQEKHISSKAAEERFSTCRNTLAQTFVPIIPDPLFYSTCWPGVCTILFVLFVFTHTDKNEYLYISV